MPTVSRSARGVEALRVAKLRVEQLEAEMENAKAEVRRLEEIELPQAFTEDGISELRLPNGQKAAKHIKVEGSLPNPEERPEDHRQAILKWIELGYEDTIRTAVAASYGVEDHAVAQQVYDTLRGDNRAFVTKKETVHPSTLKAIILARIREGKPTVPEDFGCTVIRRVRLTTPPRHRSATEED